MPKACNRAAKCITSYHVASKMWHSQKQTPSYYPLTRCVNGAPPIHQKRKKEVRRESLPPDC